ncbi:MAG: hypothetical protein IJC46_09435 [Clostridia bacterium]|nr:hypothetical protein [Clostridia bacterium]
MANNKAKKTELIIGRTSILLFWSLALGALLWAERTAWWRSDLIFKGMLPWLMPALAGVFLLLTAAIILLWKKVGAREDRLFSTPYLLYLAAAPIPALLLPWTAIFQDKLQLFSIWISVLFVGLIGYFAVYVIHANHSPAAGRLAAFTALHAMLLVGYHKLYLRGSNAFLEIKGYPNQTLMAIVATVLTAAIAFLLLRSKKKGCRLTLAALLPTVAVSAIVMIGSALFFAKLPVALRSNWLTLGTIGVEIIWMIVSIVLLKQRKKK